ncbi:MAG: hypothetical protein BYD32DRAFT_467250, partial [Podila humilis]
MLKKDERKEGKRSAETSIPPIDNGPLVDKLNALNLNNSSSSTSTSVSLPVKLETPAQTSLEDEFDLNDMDDPLAGFEAQRSGIKDLSLKEQLLNPTETNIESLTTLLTARIREGSGETLFEIGIEEDGAPMNLTDAEYQTALATVRSAAATVGAEVAIMYEKNSTPTNASGEATVEGPAPEDVFKTAYVMIRNKPKSVEELLELRVAVVGNVSTLLGVLTKGVLDDGRGKARVNLFRHKHEIDSGRTSSVGMEILGFDAKSVPVPTMSHGRNAPWDEICGKAAKVLSFIDLAGHERYLKTTVF